VFLEEWIWIFWMGQKRYLWGQVISFRSIGESFVPIRVCEFCRSVYVNADSCPGCGARQFQINGSLDEAGTQYVLDVAPRVVIANQMSFYSEFDGLNYMLKGDFKMWCHLEGLHARGVQ
jgi:hypothetical protein